MRYSENYASDLPRYFPCLIRTEIENSPLSLFSSIHDEDLPSSPATTITTTINPSFISAFPFASIHLLSASPPLPPPRAPQFSFSLPLPLPFHPSQPNLPFPFLSFPLLSPLSLSQLTPVVTLRVRGVRTGGEVTWKEDGKFLVFESPSKPRKGSQKAENKRAAIKMRREKVSIKQSLLQSPHFPGDLRILLVVNLFFIGWGGKPTNLLVG